MFSLSANPFSLSLNTDALETNKEIEKDHITSTNCLPSVVDRCVLWLKENQNSANICYTDKIPKQKIKFPSFRHLFYLLSVTVKHRIRNWHHHRRKMKTFYYRRRKSCCLKKEEKYMDKEETVAIYSIERDLMDYNYFGDNDNDNDEHFTDLDYYDEKMVDLNYNTNKPCCRRPQASSVDESTYKLNVSRSQFDTEFTTQKTDRTPASEDTDIFPTVTRSESSIRKQIRNEKINKVTSYVSGIRGRKKNTSQDSYTISTSTSTEQSSKKSAKNILLQNETSQQSEKKSEEQNVSQQSAKKSEEQNVSQQSAKKSEVQPQQQGDKKIEISPPQQSDKKFDAINVKKSGNIVKNTKKDDRKSLIMGEIKRITLKDLIASVQKQQRTKNTWWSGKTETMENNVIDEVDDGNQILFRFYVYTYPADVDYQVKLFRQHELRNLLVYLDPMERDCLLKSSLRLEARLDRRIKMVEKMSGGCRIVIGDIRQGPFVLIRGLPHRTVLISAPDWPRVARALTLLYETVPRLMHNAVFKEQLPDTLSWCRWGNYKSRISMPLPANPVSFTPMSTLARAINEPCLAHRVFPFIKPTRSKPKLLLKTSSFASTDITKMYSVIQNSNNTKNVSNTALSVNQDFTNVTNINKSSIKSVPSNIEIWNKINSERQILHKKIRCPEFVLTNIIFTHPNKLTAITKETGCSILNTTPVRNIKRGFNQTKITLTYTTEKGLSQFCKFLGIHKRE